MFPLLQEPETPLSDLRDRFAAHPRSLLNRCPGVIVVDKPAGEATSHDIVRLYRKKTGVRQMGHAGTLDPMASGALLLLLGKATRLFGDCQAWSKTYRAGFRLGFRTDTQDITGTPLPPFDPSLQVSANEVERVLTAFRGDIWQTPPMFSAIKINGRPLHELARAGQVVRREPRPARVERLALCDFDKMEGALEMTVGSGFYVRTLIDDMGQALGCGAVMTALRRMSVGPFGLGDATVW
ncbi:MAG: tRNA pseudouridine(55) synthase TruB [Planctomycetes bacterium]|nr:tRNA pseudouridine(55) synthase TruB [Planctomycetota bacterium]